MTNRNRIHIADWEIEKEQSYAYWLMCAPIGDSAKSRLLLRWGCPSEVFRAPKKALEEGICAPGRRVNSEKWSTYLAARAEDAVKRAYEELTAKGIFFYPEYHPLYPEKLRAIPSRPFGLFVKGRLPAPEKRSLAIVGARDCSEYGRYVAGYFAKKLAQSGVSVISGLARGIDGIAQRAAIEAGGESFGVLGCGVDICYPKSNEGLYRMCEECGGIVSSYLPGTPPAPGLFPPRNRIISGLSDGILIIEAREKSGTIITADLALEQGKDVFVIPGRVTDRLSDGCNGLIRQGASLIQSPEQLLEELHIGYGKVPVTGYEEENLYEQGKEIGKVQSDNREIFSQFTLEEQAFLQLFDLELLSIEQIRRKMVANSFLKNITLPQTMEMLMKFVIMGQLRAEGGYYAKMMSGIGDKS